MKQIRIAILGQGRSGRDIHGLHLKKDTERFKVVAVVDQMEIRRNRAAVEYGCDVYADYREILNRNDIDIVVNALPSNLHFAVTKDLLEHGFNVLCEKPFAVNARQAEEVLSLAAREGVYVSEAMWTWHNATARKVKEWIRQEAVGQVKQVNCDYSFPMIKLPIQKPRHTSPEMIGGAIMDIGIYCIRYCYELFGIPKEIVCDGRLKDGIDLGEKITLRYEGFDCNIRVSRDENDGERLEIIGEKGRIYLPMFHMAKKATLKTDIKQVFRDRSLLYGTQFSAVAAEIRSGAKEGIAISPQSTLDCLKITDICRDQMGLVYPCEK